MVDRRRTRRDLIRIYETALAAVDGRDRVRGQLRADPVYGPVYLIATGKAAGAMTLGACDILGPLLARGLVITRYHHVPAEISARDDLTIVEAAHPLPDENSLRAGRMLIEFIHSTPADACILFLISGGTSALVECLLPGYTLPQLQKMNAWLLGSGLDIRAMNRCRAALSAIKGGRLRHYLAGRSVRALYLSDVPGDDPAVIGSGLLASAGSAALPVEVIEAAPVEIRRFLQAAATVADSGATTVGENGAGQNMRHVIVANSSMLRQAAADQGRKLGYDIVNHGGLLLDDIGVVANNILAVLNADKGRLHIWGGEPAVVLSTSPGRGGRNQSLALTMALALDGQDTGSFLSAGTDGSDGNTAVAGAAVDGQTCACIRRHGLDPAACLASASAFTALAACDCLIDTGPTGTNVMDLMLAAGI